MKARSLSLALLTLVAACKHSSAAKGDSHSRASTRPWYLAPTEGCAFDSSVVHRDPVALLREFAGRDAQGQFLKTDPWFDKAVDCPGHEPGPDAFAVIKTYDIAFDTISGDTVRARITYRPLGWLEGGARFSADTTVEVRILKAAEGPFGWRIASPALDQHVLVDAVLGFPWLSDSISRRLRALGRGRGA